MAIVGSLLVMVGVNNAALTAGLAASQAQLKGFAATNAGTAGTFAPIGAAAGIAGLAVVAGIGMAVKAAADFESQMNTINTIARLDPEPLAKVGREIRALAVEKGADLPDLTASFYDLLSVGVPLGDAMGVLGSAVNLSLGGLGTVNEAATAITGSINAWSIAQGDANLTLADTARVTDVLATAIELGDIKARDLPAALANIAPQAANFNVSLEEVVASLALMSTKFISPAEGATAMNAAFTALQRVPPGMEKLEKATGKTYETIARNEGMHSAMMQLVADAEKFDVNLVDVFGRVDALPFVLQTTGAAAVQFGSFMAQALDPYGTAVGQANERTKGLEHQLDLLGAAANELGLKFGTALLPAATQFVTDLTGAVGTLEGVIQRIDDAYNSLPAVLREPININLEELNPVLPQPPAEGIKPGLTDIVGQALGIIPQGAFSGQEKPWGSFNTPGFHAGEVGSPFFGPPTTPAPGFFAGGPINPATGFRTGGAAFGSLQPSTRQPIHLHHTTINQIDGREIARSVETTLYNDAGVFSSGFSTDDRNRH